MGTFSSGTISSGANSSGTAPWVGIVLRDRFVIDVAQANAALEKSRSFPRRAMPADMVGLVTDYETGLKGRLYAIPGLANQVGARCSQVAPRRVLLGILRRMHPALRG